MMDSGEVRLGVDIGGTFTDVVLEVGSDLFSTKVLTTYAAPEDAIVQGLHEVCAKVGVAGVIGTGCVIVQEGPAAHVERTRTTTCWLNSKSVRSKLQRWNQ